MLKEGKYTLDEIRRILKEERQKGEFEAVKFNDDNKKNNKEGVDTIIKDTEKPYSGLKIKSQQKRNNAYPDLNKTTLDARFTIEPGKEWKERVEAQVKGYDSKLQEDNHEGNESDEEKKTRESGKEFYDERKEVSKEVSKKQAELQKSGLAARVIADEEPEVFKPKTAFTNEGVVRKRLHFKNTVFLSEDRIKQLVPEEYKKDGNRFYMTDSTGTDYLVECKADDTFSDFVKVNIVNKINRKQVNEQLDRIKDLFKYNSADFNKPNRADNLANDMNVVRNLQESKSSTNSVVE